MTCSPKPSAATTRCLCAERDLLGDHEEPCAGFGSRSDELCEQAEREAVAAGEWPPESPAAQVYDDLDDRQRADRIDDICDSLSEENVPPDALAPIRAYAGWLRDGVLASENECDAAALLREFEQLPVRRVTDQTVVMERSPLDGWRARCGRAVRRG